MIKRPLVWMLCAYLAGMCLAWLKLPVIILIILELLLCLLIYFFTYRWPGKVIGRQDKFLWCLPLLLSLGFFALKDQLAPPKLYEAFAQESECELTGSIRMIVNRESGKTIYLKNNTVSLWKEKQYTCENVIVFCYDKQDHSFDQYQIGNRITVYGTLKKFSQATNPGQFNEKLYYQIENIDFKMTAESITVIDGHCLQFPVLLEKLKNKLLEVYQSILPKKEAGTMIAMLLGEKYLLEDEIKQLYQQNGISHVLAISGLHISLIGLSLFWLLKKLKIPIIPATLLSIFCIYSYGVLTNFSVSTNRAVVMMTIMLIARLFGKTYDMLTSLSLSALIILLQNPLQLFSAGFLLSFGAVLGIAVIFPCLKALLPIKHGAIDGLLVSLSAQLATTPCILWFFYQFPTYSVLVNLLILPFVTVLTLTSLLAGIAGIVSKPLGLFLAGGPNYILKLYELICRIGSGLPGNLVTTGRPEILRLLFYTLLILLFLGCARRYQKKSSLLLLAVAFLVLLFPGRNPGLQVTVLDVGQGDGIYMESKNGTTYLIDGGSSDISRVGTYRLQPFLLSQGTDYLDFAVITHSDNDHISGLKELIENGNIAIGKLVMPEIENKDEAYLALEALAQDNNISVQYIGTGDYIMDGGVRILCLHPSSGYQADSTNGYSTVLSVSYEKFDMLLTGDLEKDGENRVMKLLEDETQWSQYFSDKINDIPPVTDYDVLKVAHHGSKNSTFDAFLKLISPEVSLISCGRNNSYGHPHQELLERLENSGSRILITYETGAITIKTDGKSMEVKQYLH